MPPFPRRLALRQRPTPPGRPFWEPALALEPRELLAVITWDGSADASWHTAANWDLGRVPAAADDVVIPALAATPFVEFSTGSVTVNSVTSAERLLITGGTLGLAAASSLGAGVSVSGGRLSSASTVAATGASVWTGGTLSGNGALSVPAGSSLEVSGATARVLDDLNLSVSGALDWTATDVTLQGGVTVSVSTGGVFNLAPAGAAFIRDGDGAAANDTIAVSGAFNKNGAGQATVQCVFRLNSTGVCTVNAGARLTLAGGDGSGDTNGDFVLAGDSLELAAGAFSFLSTTSVTGAGTLIASGATLTLATDLDTAVRVTGGTVDQNVASSWPRLDMEGGTLSGAASLTLTGTASAWTGGTITAAKAGAMLVVGSEGRMVVSGAVVRELSRPLVIDGAVAWSADSVTVRGAAVGVNGRLDLDSGAGSRRVLSVVTATTPTLTVAASGTLSKTGAGSFEVAAVVRNDGSVAVDAGRLLIHGGGVASTGDFAVAGAATLEFGGPVRHEFAATSAITGGGDVEFTGTLATVHAGTIATTGNVRLAATGAVFSGPAYSSASFTAAGGGATVSRAWSVTDRVSIAAGAAVAFETAAQSWPRLVMTGGTLQGTAAIALTGAGPGSAWSGGTWGAGGAVSIGAGHTLGVAGDVVLGRALTSHGTLNWSAGDLSMTGTTLTVAGGVFNVSSTGRVLGTAGVNRVLNNAELSRSGAGLSTIAVRYDTGSASAATLVAAGTLSLSAGGTHDGGFSVAAGASLRYTGDQVFNAASFITGAGGFEVAGGSALGIGPFTNTGGAVFSGGVVAVEAAAPFTTGPVTVSGASVTLTQTIDPGPVTLLSGTLAVGAAQTWGSLSMSGGRLEGAAPVRLTGASSYTGGTLAHGALTVDGGATLAVSGPAPKTVEGLVIVEGTAGFIDTAVAFDALGAVDAGFRAVGGEIALTGDHVTLTSGNPEFGTLSVRSQGLLRIDLAGAAEIGAGVQVLAGASVRVDAGTVRLTGGGESRSGFTLADAARLLFDSPFLLGAGAGVSGGAMVIGATLTVGEASDTSTFTGAVALGGAGVLAGDGTAAFGGTLTWEGGSMTGGGTTLILPGGVLNIASAASKTLTRALTNAGVTRWLAGRLFVGDAPITNTGGAAPGVFEVLVTEESIVPLSGPGAFNNAGRLARDGAGAADIRVPFENTGEVIVRAGALLLPEAAQLAGGVLSGGSWLVSGTGVLDLAGDATIASLDADFTLAGPDASAPDLATLETVAGSLRLDAGADLAPAPASGTFTNAGSISLSPGSTLAITGAFAQTEGGALRVVFAGGASPEQFGRVTVSGAGAIAGAFVAVYEGYTPAAGDAPVFLVAAGLVGGFAPVDIPAPVHGLRTVVSVGPAGLRLLTTSLADVDGSGEVDVADIFVYLSLWFAQDPAADLDGTSGVNVADIFVFLSLWFGA